MLDLATCVWVGYPIADANDPARPDRSISMYGVEGYGTVMGPNLPALIWHAYMTAATAGTPATDWPEPRNAVQWLPFFNSHYTGLAFVPPPPPKPHDDGAPARRRPGPRRRRAAAATTGPGADRHGLTQPRGVVIVVWPWTVVDVRRGVLMTVENVYV